MNSSNMMTTTTTTATTTNYVNATATLSHPSAVNHQNNNNQFMIQPQPQPQPQQQLCNDLQSVQIENEIFEIPSRYKLIELRGQGSYGVVCSARDTLSHLPNDVTAQPPTANNPQQHNMVAIKKNRNVFPRTIAPQLPPSSTSSVTSHHDYFYQQQQQQQTVAYNGSKKLPHRSKLSQKRILRELKILSHLRGHPNIIQLHDVIQPRSYEAFGDVYFVTDLMEADLRDILESNQPLTDQHVQYFMYQLLLAIHYSQSANILHRDLKPENILLNSNCELKICDFGLARGIDFECNPRMSTNYVQTRWYRAPELLLNNPTVSKQADMWSIGCILGELLGRRVMFKGSCPVDQMKKIIHVMGTPSAEDIRGSEEGVRFVMELPYSRGKDLRSMFPTASDTALDLLRRMLEFNHDKRITTEQALKHPYFKDLYDERDVRVCDKLFDFSFEDHLDDEPNALKDCAYETIMHFHQNMCAMRQQQQLEFQQQQQQLIQQQQQQTTRVASDALASESSSSTASSSSSSSSSTGCGTSTSTLQPHHPLTRSHSATEQELRRRMEKEEERRKQLEQEEKQRQMQQLQQQQQRTQQQESEKKKKKSSRFEVLRRVKSVFSL